MRVKLAYGRDGLWVDLPDRNVTVLEPTFVPGLSDEPGAIRQAMREPIGAAPLRELVHRDDSVAIVFSDLTRPMPNDRVLPVLLAELAHIPNRDIVLINALGTHRANTPEELDRMLGSEITGAYRIVQHDCTDKGQMTYLGETRYGHPIWVNNTYLAAKVKILTGFIEPHFFAGFSGGPKAVLPGIAGEETILGNHSGPMIGHPGAGWGRTIGSPVWEEILEVAQMTRPDFILNVTLNRERAITRVFAGKMESAHRQGTEFARKQAMVSVDRAFDIVISTNSGYPLDLNLYQAVKGMSAAAQVVKPGGAIVLAAECWDGIPNHGEYRSLLHMADHPQKLLDIVNQPGFSKRDQWEVLVQALIQLKADVHLKSTYLPDAEIRGALLTPWRRRWPSSSSGTVVMLLSASCPKDRRPSPFWHNKKLPQLGSVGSLTSNESCGTKIETHTSRGVRPGSLFERRRDAEMSRYGVRQLRLARNRLCPRALLAGCRDPWPKGRLRTRGICLPGCSTILPVSSTGSCDRTWPCSERHLAASSLESPSTACAPEAV
jgi:nickel-dependent lactate racemase